MWGTITGLYIVCLAIGFIYALVGAIFGELGSHGDAVMGDHGGIDVGSHDVHMGDHGVAVGDHGAEVGDHNMEVSHADMHDLHVSPFNSITIATFIGSFGAMGLIALWGLRLQGLSSILFAIPAAFISAGVQFYLYAKLVGSSASSEATMSDIERCTAEVITPIPENGVGEIAYNIKGSRYTAPARSVDGNEIPRGGRVRVVRCAAGVMQVRQF